MRAINFSKVSNYERQCLEDLGFESEGLGVNLETFD